MPRATVTRLPQIGLLSSTGIILFLLLSVLVHTGMLGGVDLAATQAIQALGGKPLDLFAAAVSILLSFELSVLYAVIASLFFWRAGLGLWSLAPLAFVPLLGLEIALKLTIHQTQLPPDLHRRVSYSYPLATLTLQGSFPSGHAIRIGFGCAFTALLLHARGRRKAGVTAVGLACLAGLLSLTRVYLGQHWLSDVLAGVILGASVGLLTAASVVRRLVARPSQCLPVA